MQGEKTHGQDFSYHDQVSEIGPGKIFASITGAVTFDGVGVGFIFFIFNTDIFLSNVITYRQYPFLHTS